MKIIDIITETTDGLVYAVGDSHAEGIANSSNGKIKNYAQGAQSSTARSNYSSTYKGRPVGIENIPKGSSVVIAQGCNDAASSLRGNIESKMPLVSPEKIASNVAKLVSASTNLGHKVIFVLFPNGDPTKQKWYGGEYTEKVRQAIKSAVGVPVIDMDGCALADGVHAVAGAYASTASQVIAKLGKTATVDAPAEVKKVSTPGIKTKSPRIDVPSSRVGTEVADVQKVLLALGYKLPKHGVDGVRGPETSAAIREFQRDNGLAIDGDPGPETVSAINNIVVQKDIAFEKSTDADVKRQHATAYIDNPKLAPVNYDAVTTGKVGEILNLIARVESGGYYDVMNGMKRYPDILKMTLSELLKFQARYTGGTSSAAGRYQYVPDTLVWMGRKMGVDFNQQKFDPEFQDKLAIFDMRTRCQLDGWLDNKVSDTVFLTKLAGVWAGLPNPSTGLSTYNNVLNNKNGISTKVALNNLNDIKSA